MNKKEFLQSFDYDDISALANLYEKVTLSNKTGKCIFSNEFYPPSVWSKLSQLENKIQVKVDTFGVLENADRRLIAFNRLYEEEFPVILIGVDINKKFENIDHRDCLGSLMSLGLKREKFGDLILDDNKLYFPIVDEVFDYLNDNLSKIKHTPVKLKKLDIYLETPKVKYEEKIVITSSLRLDALVSSITGISRSKSLELINRGFVKVNYVVETEKDKYIKFNDVITISKHGKFIINEQISITNKDRIRIKLKKFT